MKKIITMVLLLFILITPVEVFATNNASVEIKVNGEVKKDSDIEIFVNLNDVDKLYAASIDFIYNTNQLKVESINSTEYVTKHIDNIMELGGETNKNSNTASYSFTFLGDLDGLSESGTLVKIKAKVLSNDKLSIAEDNMKVKLVQRYGDTVRNYDYKFLGYSEASTESNSNSSNNSSQNIGSSNTNESTSVENNTSSGNKNLESSNNERNETNGGNTDESNSGKNSGDKNSSNNNADNAKSEDGVLKINNSNNGSEEVSKSNIINVFFAVIVIGVLAGSAYYYYKVRKSKKNN